MKNLNRTLAHSAELTKMLSHALEIHTPDSVEEARVGKQIATMQAQATQIEEQLQRLCSEYAVEVNTTKLRLWERKLLDLTLRNNLLNMRMGRNCLPYAHADVAQLEDERRTQAEGVLGLKRFLQFAQQGTCLAPGDATEKANSLMIQQIATQLENLGYEVHTAVGASDFKIDIAVVDPALPDKYLLGIICDGEGYYRLKTVRDREVVQPTVLRMLGWNLMHIWSIDWLQHQEMILKRVNDKIKEIRYMK